jgi:serine/threonine protein kinase
MPKAVDIYVLDKKIGSGQFGDVFKGYSKVDGTDVAIKTIRRDKVKGNILFKFVRKIYIITIKLNSSFEIM